MAEPNPDGVSMLRRLGANAQAAGLQRLAVFAMFPLIGLIGWFAMDLLGTERKAVDQLIQHISIIDDRLSTIGERVTKIEATRDERDRETSANQAALLSAQQTMQGAVSALTSAVAVLSDRVQMLIDQKHAAPAH